MAIQSANTMTLVGQLVLKLTQLAEEDLPLVLEFVDYLTHSAPSTRQVQQRQTTLPKRLSAAQIQTEARRQAQVLRQVPRTEIVTRFQKLAEEIRQTAIAKNTAVEGDWLDD